MSRHGSKSAFFVARVSHVQSQSAIIYKMQAKKEKLLKVLQSHTSYISSLNDQIAYLQEKMKRVPFEKQNEILTWIQGKGAKIVEVQRAIVEIQAKLEQIEKTILYYL